VHAKTVVACLLKQGYKQIRTFSTMTDELLQLLDWLSKEGSTHVVIESTGVYWKPVFNILEGVLGAILVNARHVTHRFPGFHKRIDIFMTQSLIVP